MVSHPDSVGEGQVRPLPSAPGVTIKGITSLEAKQSVVDFHYSQVMPVSNPHCYGVWEGETYIGAIVFGFGANRHIGTQFGLTWKRDVLELTRVAFTNHTIPVTQAVALAIKQLKHDNPAVRLLVSYADPKQGHLGKIYQAGNWIYTGTSKPQQAIVVLGRERHKKSVSQRYGRADVDWLRKNVDPLAHTVSTIPKHRYLFPLDKAMRRQIQSLAKLPPTTEVPMTQQEAAEMNRLRTENEQLRAWVAWVKANGWEPSE